METEILQHRIKYNYFDSDDLPEEMTTPDDEHIWKMIMEGYSSGELNGDDYRGRWEIITETNKTGKPEIIKELQKIYQSLQDENERFKNEDGYGQYTSDGEWLDQFLPLINKLLE